MGPITSRQFIILIFTAGFIFVCYKIGHPTFWIVEAVIIFAAGGSFAFFKVNGRPIHYFFLNLIQTFRKPGLRVWRKEVLPVVEKVFRKERPEAKEEVIPRRSLPRSRLSQLSLLVDTGGRYEEE